MVEELMQKGITDEAVLEAIGLIPRHQFVEGVFGEEAYLDKALPIAEKQTISQPFTVAYQSQLLQLKPRMKVLEIGTGSGYQAAILCAMKLKVFSVELIPRLHRTAKERLEDLGFSPKLRLGDGSEGWQGYQPFERILVTAASPNVPETLKRQLSIGGRMVVPVGDRREQQMQVIIRLSKDEFEIQSLKACKFVPLLGKYGFS
jgi:protein-L-isoaspartate(D-aspartate) O-methyltransferase